MPIPLERFEKIKVGSDNSVHSFFMEIIIKNFARCISYIVFQSERN